MITHFAGILCTAYWWHTLDDRHIAIVCTKVSYDYHKVFKVLVTWCGKAISYFLSVKLQLNECTFLQKYHHYHQPCVSRSPKPQRSRY